MTSITLSFLIYVWYMVKVLYICIVERGKRVPDITLTQINFYLMKFSIDMNRINEIQTLNGGNDFVIYCDIYQDSCTEVPIHFPIANDNVIEYINNRLSRHLVGVYDDDCVTIGCADLITSNRIIENRFDVTDSNAVVTI